MKFFQPKVTLNASTIVSLDTAKLIIKWLLETENFTILRLEIACLHKEEANSMQRIKIRTAILFKEKAYNLEIIFLIKKTDSWKLVDKSSPVLTINKSEPLILLQRNSETGLSFCSTNEDVLKKIRKKIS